LSRCTVGSLKEDQEADWGEKGRDPSRVDSKTIRQVIDVRQYKSENKGEGRGKKSRA
jgi:hypothetical protein